MSNKSLEEYSLTLWSSSTMVSNMSWRFLSRFQSISRQKLGRNDVKHDKKLSYQLLDGVLFFLDVEVYHGVQRGLRKIIIK